MAEMYNDQLTEVERSRISFLIVNEGNAVRDAPALRSAAGTIPVIQDSTSNTLLGSISNFDRSPKDDMALFDSEGRLIRYFESNQSFLGTENNAVLLAVREVTADGYVSPCAAPAPSSGGAPSGGAAPSSSSGALTLEGFRELCKADEESCTGCKGKMKPAGCRLKKRLKCKLMRSEAMCRAARCKAKAKRGTFKCKDKSGNVFE